MYIRALFGLLLALLPCINCQAPEWPRDLGCYSNYTSLVKNYVKKPEMSIQMCMENCMGFTYARVQYKGCGCGSNYDRSVPEDSSKCVVPCADGSGFTCGGHHVYNILQLRTPADFDYLGCSSTEGNPAAVDKTEISDLTLEKCATHCANHRFFGVEKKMWCYCSDRYASPVVDNEACLSNGCMEGDDTVMCGTNGFMAFYYVARSKLASSQPETGGPSFEMSMQVMNFDIPTHGRVRANKFRNKSKVIIPDYSVTVQASGEVTSFNVTAMNNESMEISFWRPTEDKMTFSYVGGYDYKAEEKGNYLVELGTDDRIEVEEGDVFGLYLPKNAAFYHNQDRDGCEDRIPYLMAVDVDYPFAAGNEIKMRATKICGVPLVSDIGIMPSS